CFPLVGGVSRWFPVARSRPHRTVVGGWLVSQLLAHRSLLAHLGALAVRAVLAVLAHPVVRAVRAVPAVLAVAAAAAPSAVLAAVLLTLVRLARAGTAGTVVPAVDDLVGQDEDGLGAAVDVLL